MIIQTGIDAAQKIAPNTYLIILLALFVAEKVISMTFKGITLLKGSNGKGGETKDETKHLPCLMNPMFTGPWETHKQETHDTMMSSTRIESGMKKLVEQSVIRTGHSKRQTEETIKQTGILEKIQKNGSKDGP